MKLTSISKSIKQHGVLVFLHKKLSSIVARRAEARSIRWCDLRHKSRVVGKNILTDSQREQIKQYYGKWFPIDVSAHEFYTEKTGRFYVEWIPDGLYYRRIDRHFNDWGMAKYIDNKTFYGKLFKNVRQPDVICTRENGYWFDRNHRIVSLEDALKIIRENEECFVKVAVGSYGGRGVTYYDSRCQDSEVLKTLFKSTKRDIVVQKPVKQSATIARLNSSSVNTIRVISLLERDGSVNCLSGVLRMGVNGMKVDNATSGGITCGIEPNGRLKSVAYSQVGFVYHQHPNSNLKFNEIVIPKYENILKSVRELHPQVPHFRLVSWDFALDESDCPVLIEANLCDGELDFHQLNNGPLFGSDLTRIMDEVFWKK